MKKRLCLLLLGILITCIVPVVAYAADAAAPLASPSASASATNALLSIDNANVYAGMGQTYSHGYVPGINNGTATVVVPLVSSGSISNNTIKINVGLGDAASSPFVFGNYDQTITQQNNAVNNGATTIPSYLVTLNLPMVASRTMGRYPVTVTANYTADDGTGTQVAVSQTFTVYVTVSDGKDPNATPTPSPTPTASEAPLPQPKIIIKNHQISPEVVQAGSAFDLVVTLLNTSDNQSVQNITVTTKGDTTDLIPLNDTGSAYIKRISSGKTADFHTKMQVRQDAKAGAQKILIAITYENNKAAAFTENYEIIVQVSQPIRLEYDKPKIPQTVNAGDTISISLNLMNMGKSTLYNVRCSLSAPGLIPEGSTFLGNMDAGTTKSGDINIFVGTLDMTADSGETALPSAQGSNSNYGPTQGKITITYEDQNGKEYSQDIDISTTIGPPVIQTQASANPEDQKKTETVGQWWISVLIAGGIAAGLIVFLRIRKKKKALLEDSNEIE